MRDVGDTSPDTICKSLVYRPSQVFDTICKSLVYRPSQVFKYTPLLSGVQVYIPQIVFGSVIPCIMGCRVVTIFQPDCSCMS